MTAYGSFFTKEQIDAVITDVQRAEALYLSKNIAEEWLVLDLLKKYDDRFQLKPLKKNIYIYFFGIFIYSVRDDETFGAFKESIEKALSETFKTQILPSFIEIKDDEYDN